MKVSPLIKVSIVLSSLIFILSSGFKTSNAVSDTQKFYRLYLDSLQITNNQLEQKTATSSAEELQELFKKCRNHYKKIEFITEYYLPKTAVKINGIPLPESSAAEPGEIIYPSGFQVLEPLLYQELTTDLRKNIAFEVSNITNAINHFKATASAIELTESQILDALKLNIYRMTIKGIAGFDAPVALSGISEAKSTLECSKIVFSFFNNSEDLINSCNKAIHFIEKSPADFNEFDRATFIRQYINALCTSLYNYQEKQGIPVINEPRAISSNAKHLF